MDIRDIRIYLLRIRYVSIINVWRRSTIWVWRRGLGGCGATRRSDGAEGWCWRGRRQWASRCGVAMASTDIRGGGPPICERKREKRRRRKTYVASDTTSHGWCGLKLKWFGSGLVCTISRVRISRMFSFIVSYSKSNARQALKIELFSI